jgi:hypothetical protein
VAYQFPSMASAFVVERLFAASFAALLSFGCSSGDGIPPPATGITPAPEDEPWPTLEDWHLFVDAPTQLPGEDVIPYDVNSPLYADYASKYRFLHVPAGKHIGYA